MLDFIYGRLANRPDVPPIKWNPDSKESMNPHMLIAGSSGSGKTTFLLKIVNYLEKIKKHIYIFDLKGDMVVKDDVGNIIGNYLEFTAWSSKYGINPFEFDTGVSKEEITDFISRKKEPTKEQLYKIKNSGPKVQVNRVIEIIKKNFMPNMGTNQKDILFALLLDTYKMKGFIYNKYETWDNELPSLEDTLELINRINLMFNMQESFVASSKGVKFLSNLEMAISKYKTQAKVDGETDTDNEIKDENLDNDLLEESYKLLHKYIKSRLKADNGNNINNIEDIENWFVDFGIDASIYMKKEVIRTVEKLSSYVNALVSSEIFNSNPPPVKPGLNIINISGLDVEIQRFIVDVWLGKVFKACKIRGTYAEREHRPRGEKVDTYIIIDESKLIAGTSRDKNDPYSYLNRIATESRGFGMGIIVAAQSAEHFPPEFLKNFDSQIILNTGIADFDAARRSFGVDKELLNFTQNGWGNILVKTGKKFSKVKLDSAS